MAMDSLRNPQCGETVVLYATDPGGSIARLPAVRSHLRPQCRIALLHAPATRDPERLDGVHGRQGNRRAPRPRGRRGLAELRRPSPRLLREPEGILEKIAGRLISVGDTWFQIERLYRFNAKFFPRWEPRYFMYERRFGLPRAAIAALWLEGQVPRPALGAARRARRRVA